MSENKKISNGSLFGLSELIKNIQPEKRVIYGVWDGDYEDRYCAGLFEVKEDAEEYKEQVCPDGWVKEMELNPILPHEKGWRDWTVVITEDGEVEGANRKDPNCYDNYYLQNRYDNWLGCKDVRIFCFNFEGVGLTELLVENKARKLLEQIKLSVGDLSELEEYEPINYELLGIKKEEI